MENIKNRKFEVQTKDSREDTGCKIGLSSFKKAIFCCGGVSQAGQGEATLKRPAPG